VLFLPGQKAERFFVVISGCVKVHQLSPEGDEQILHLFGPGQTFAEAVALAGGRYPAGAEAVEDSLLLAVPRATLRRHIDCNAELAIGMLAGMAAKLQEFTRLIERLSLKDVPARLADWLLEASGDGRQNAIRLHQTKRQLASQLGTVPETLSRALAKLASAGLIRVDGPRMVLLDVRRLAELAGRR
jgi:CRP/FNR family transcriptional regulator